MSQNAINSSFSRETDGFIFGGGVTERLLTLTGGSLTLAASSDQTLTLQAQDGTITLQDTATLTAGSIPFADVTGLLSQDNTNLIWDDTNNILTTSGLLMTGRIQEDKGADVASADEVTLGGDGNYFDITGVTTINHITTTGWQSGSLFTLQFDGVLTVTHNAATPTGTEASIILATGTNFTTAAGDTITLRYDGVTFREIGRVGAGGSGTQNLWETITGDTGSIAANVSNDTFDIGGGTGISTAISGDGVIITNDSPNVDQNLFLNVLSDSGTATADTTTDTLSILGAGNLSTSVAADALTITLADAYLLNTGDIGTGVYDFGGADSFEIPNSATPTVNANGEIAIDTTVTDFSAGVLKYFSTEEMGVVAMPIAEFTTPTDGHVVSYNATNDEFELVAAGAGGATGIYEGSGSLSGDTVVTMGANKLQFDRTGSAGFFTLRSDTGSIGIDETTPTSTIQMGGLISRNILVGRINTGSGSSFDIAAGGAEVGATDTNGGTMRIKGGIATGSGHSRIEFQTAGGFGTGTTDRNPITRFGVVDNNIGLRTTSQFGSGVGVFGMRDATTAPSTTPGGGGVLYSQGGALKWKGSGGTITTIAVA